MRGMKGRENWGPSRIHPSIPMIMSFEQAQQSPASGSFRFFCPECSSYYVFIVCFLLSFISPLINHLIRESFLLSQSHILPPLHALLLILLYFCKQHLSPSDTSHVSFTDLSHCQFTLKQCHIYKSKDLAFLLISRASIKYLVICVQWINECKNGHSMPICKEAKTHRVLDDANNLQTTGSHSTVSFSQIGSWLLILPPSHLLSGFIG